MGFFNAVWQDAQPRNRRSALPDAQVKGAAPAPVTGAMPVGGGEPFGAAAIGDNTPDATHETNQVQRAPNRFEAGLVAQQNQKVEPNQMPPTELEHGARAVVDPLVVSLAQDEGTDAAQKVPQPRASLDEPGVDPELDKRSARGQSTTLGSSNPGPAQPRGGTIGCSAD